MSDIPQWAKECAQAMFREEAARHSLDTGVGNNPPAWAALDALARYIAYGGIAANWPGLTNEAQSAEDWWSDEDRAFFGDRAIPNPNRKWWQFWKSKRVIDSQWTPDQIARFGARDCKSSEINRLPPLNKAGHP